MFFHSSIVSKGNIPFSVKEEQVKNHFRCTGNLIIFIWSQIQMELTVLKQGGVFFLTVDDIILNLIGFFFLSAALCGVKVFGSISVSGQLPTYPSPNSTTVN